MAVEREHSGYSFYEGKYPTTVVLSLLTNMSALDRDSKLSCIETPLDDSERNL